MRITENLYNFIFDRTSKLKDLGISLSELELDHFGYQTESTEEYEKLKEESRNIGTLRSENIVSERRVAIFELKCPVQFGNNLLSGFELVEPKPKQICTSGLEYIAFIIPNTFNEFISKYPKIIFDIKSKDRDLFPKIMYIFEDGTSAKFHLKNILQEI